MISIKERRIAKGLTQEELAKKLGVTLATVQRWEQERHNPSPLATRRINRILGK